MEDLAWLLALYARYFVAVFAAAMVVLGLLWLVYIRAHPRTSPEPRRAQTSAPDRTTAA